MSGALLNLVTQGTIENRLGLTNRRAIEIYEQNFNNKRLTINRDGDIFNLHSIQFRDTSDNFEFKRLYIDIGSNTILTLDSILMKFYHNSKYNSYQEEKVIDNQRVITFNIPWQELGYQDLLKIVALQFHNVTFRIEYQGTCCESVVLGYYTYLDTVERLQIARGDHQISLFQLQKQNLIQSSNTQTHTLLFNGIINGLFIIGLNYSNISNLEILYNGQSRLKLNKFNLPYLVRRLSETCFYVPFDGNFNFNNTDLNLGSDFGRITDVRLNVTTTTPTNFQVGVKTVNLLRIVMGMGGLVFSYGTDNNPSISNNLNNIFVRENKVISGDTLCAVNYEEIEENDEYLNCGKCHKNFLLNIVQQWVQEKKKCPMCQQQWINWKIYKNC